MIDTLFSGLIHGSAYALVAVGMSLIFGVTNVANFAQGSIVAVGIMVAWWLGSSLGWGILPTILVVIVVTGLLGLLMNTAVIAPLEGRKPIAALLATIGIGQILDNGLQIIFGPQTRPFPKLLPTYNLQLFGVRFGTSDVVMVVLTVVLMLGLWAFLKYGKTGQAIRATSQDPEAARQMGIPVKSIRNISFVIGSVLAGISGIFVGLFNANINPMNGGTIGMTAFVAATIGGLGSIPGAVVGGLVLGVVESLGISWLGDGAHDLITFGALLLILIVKPQGLLGPKNDVKSEPLTGTFLGGGRPIALPWWANAGLAVALLATPFFFSDYLAGVGTQIAIYAIAAVGLTLISGSAGQTILGMAGPLAAGAYASAILTTQLHWPFLIALPAAGIVAAIAASILTFPVWKLSGHYVAIATIGVGAVMVAIIRLWEPLTKGSLGIQGIPFPTIFGQVLFTQQMQYLMDIVILLFALVVVMRIRSSHLGRVFEAVGSDQEASQALGVRTSAYKSLAYALAAFFTGLAGALLAHQYTYIDPTIFTSSASVLILTIIVLGGMNSSLGAVLGSIILIGGPELLRIVPDARIIVYGVLLVLVILFRPQGLFARKG
ncbi:ABC transporter permease [Bifidobacterium crudilactis]|jgi:branched-chain amino acid transport system permease protein|uniref:ABC transporter permease n=1 Tax=Bifidobacterium crudilactis TaxID=327277 RepID=UPI000557136D|nr:ABC transporter permease [Bifidobacterium crudilactis]MCI2148133.1 ABC transporter permease [Bifidobacterium crudilactis]MCI2157185.1 ABC transporter permease [Bifidobacterium crudilactis]